ncbi:MAG TPA: hypothetical protein VIV12_06350, partial [Streptosporangiaceae bacterium]
WAKRDYGVAGQYGLEASPAAYVATLREVFHQAHRVLADDGTCWLNLGDSYSAGGAAPTGLHTYVGRGLAGRHTPGQGTKTCSACPGKSPLLCKTTGGSSATRSCGTSPTPCPNLSATGSTAATN